MSRQSFRIWCAFLLLTSSMIAPSASSAESSSAQPDWIDRLPPSTSFVLIAQPDHLGSLCRYLAGRAHTDNLGSTLALVDHASSLAFTLAEGVDVRRLMRPCQAPPSALRGNKLEHLDGSRAIVFAVSTVAFDAAIDKVGPTTLALPEVSATAQLAARLSLPSDEPDALRKEFEAACERAGEKSQYVCDAIGRMQVHGDRLEIDVLGPLGRNLDDGETLPDLAELGWKVDATDSTTLRRDTAAAQAALDADGDSDAALRLYVTADGWYRFAMAARMHHAAAVAHRRKPSRGSPSYRELASRALEFIYIRALAAPEHSEVEDMTFVISSDDESLGVDLVQGLTPYGVALMDTASGVRAPSVASSRALLSGEVAFDLPQMAKVIRPVRWLLEPLKTRPDLAYIKKLAPSLDDHSLEFYAARDDDNPIFDYLRPDRRVARGAEHLGPLFHPLSAAAQTLDAFTPPGEKATTGVPPVSAVSFAVDVIVGEPPTLRGALTVVERSTDSLLAVISALVDWPSDAPKFTSVKLPEHNEMAQTLWSVGQGFDVSDSGLVESEFARISLDTDRLEAQLEVLRDGFARADMLGKIAPFLTAIACPSPHAQHGCLFLPGGIEHPKFERRRGNALAGLLASTQSFGLRASAKGSTRMFRFRYGTAQVTAPVLPDATAKPRSTDAPPTCAQDAMWAASKFMSTEMVGVSRLLHATEVMRGARSQRVGNPNMLRFRRVDYDVDSIRKAHKEHLRAEARKLAAKLQKYEATCKEAGEPWVTQVRETRKFWQAWKPTLERTLPVSPR